MSRPSQPPLISARMSLQVRTVEGHFTVLSLPATDHRIVAGDASNYLVGFGTVHEFSKEGLYLRSGPAPAVLGEVPAGGEHLW
jgi:hypothetical protein